MLGTGELVIIFCVVLLLFGGKRLPELARSLGHAIREFKDACQVSADAGPASKDSAGTELTDKNKPSASDE
jgi:sec-independent protein translocase protein TatA